MHLGQWGVPLIRRALLTTNLLYLSSRKNYLVKHIPSKPEVNQLNTTKYLSPIKSIEGEKREEESNQGKCKPFNLKVLFLKFVVLFCLSFALVTCNHFYMEAKRQSEDTNVTIFATETIVSSVSTIQSHPAELSLSLSKQNR